ncbi:MAG: exodeoxyribonuclease VII large subunit [Bacilli bacterium]|nr:exodeoxyribonuclease VII large subunit [Bacilli bacterium]
MQQPPKALTVTELNTYIKSKLEGDPTLASFYLRAEISNFKTYSSGHSYFTLKDSQSMVSAVMWATYAMRLSFVPKDGDEVLVHCRIALYPPRGSYQVSVDSMEPFGQGAELLRLQQLKEKLQKEGLFDPSKKRPIHPFPKKVGVIAGKGSAGLRDVIVNVYKRWPLVELVEFPSLVQGKEAPKDLLRALALANQSGLDTLIIARGGGSSEDLSAFNDEAFVRALAKCPCPTISAVGHEVDTTLTDLVADLRVSTPTAAAVASVPDKFEVYQRLDEGQSRLETFINAFLARQRQALEYLSTRAFFLRPESIYAHQLENLELTSKRLDMGLSRLLEGHKAHVGALEGKLNALNPKGVLTRGYAIVYDEEGKPVGDIAALRPGERIKTQTKDGIITSEVLSTRKGNPNE